MPVVRPFRWKLLFLRKALPLALTAVFRQGILSSPSHGCVLCNTSAYFTWHSHPVGQLAKHCLDAPKWTYFKFAVIKYQHNYWTKAKSMWTAFYFPEVLHSSTSPCKLLRKIYSNRHWTLGKKYRCFKTRVIDLFWV